MEQYRKNVRKLHAFLNNSFHQLCGGTFQSEYCDLYYVLLGEILNVRNTFFTGKCGQGQVQSLFKVISGKILLILNQGLVQK